MPQLYTSKAPKLQQYRSTNDGANKMKRPKIAPVLLVLILAIELSIPVAMSLLSSTYVIRSSGTVGLINTTTYASELRGVFVHEGVYSCNPNWTVIAQTLAQYGVNTMLVNDQGGMGRRPDSSISAAIIAAHANGLKYYSVSNVLVETKDSSHPECYAIKYDGGVEFNGFAQCPIKAHDIIVQNTVAYFNAHPDVDGLMFDYFRYYGSDSCYCPQCKAAFEQWLGEGPITDWTQFYPGGARYGDYAEWRTIPVTQLAEDIANAVRAIKPNLVISQVPWTLFSNSPTYWRYYLGQDTGAWIKEGYLDFVAPMMYTQTIYGEGETLESEIDADLDYMTAGPRGKIPLVAFLDCARGITVQGLKDEIDYVRSRGLDGWIIWAYGGPGVTGYSVPDITPFLAAINMPDTFTLSNIQVSVSVNSTTVSWSTTLPASSAVEYSTSPLFNATWSISNGFHYWKINKINGTLIEDNTTITAHTMTILGLTPGTMYYFRVQSRDNSGTATSRTLSFTTTTSP
jgi:hypothetical protein